MTYNNQAVSGTVLTVQPDGSYTVVLSDGSRGSVPPGEISRQNHTRSDASERIIGRQLLFLRTGSQPDGASLLSARAYEEQVYQKICSDFHASERNIYPARLISVTADGKLAFYRLAQGVSGALHVSAFSLSRIHSFREIDLPRQLPVAVSGIDARGFISLSTKPAFGDFEYSVRRLALTDGCTADGVVSSLLPDGAASIMLAPNLIILADARFPLRAGEAVRLRCRRIDHAQRRIRVQITERLPGPAPRFPYDQWTLSADSLPAFVDLTHLDLSLRPVRPSQAEPREAERLPAPVIEYAVTATRSPFSSYLNERIVREPRRASRVQDIYFESRMGYLNDRHLKTAQAIEALKYSSAWQVRRYIHLRHGLNISDRELKGIIDRLVKHDIVAVLRFHSDEGSLLTRVLHPSLNYQALCGTHPRSFSPKDFIESDPISVKTRLAANQLLIALLHSYPSVDSVDTHPFLLQEESDVRVRPKHLLRCEGRSFCLEAVRTGREEEMLSKLRRYDLLWSRQKEETGVIITLESNPLIPAMARRIEELRLSFPVWLTDDLSCLPEPVFTEIPPAGQKLLRRLLRIIEGNPQP